MDGITCNKEGVISESSISVDIIPAHPCSAVQSWSTSNKQGRHQMARRRFQEGFYFLKAKADGTKYWVLRY